MSNTGGVKSDGTGIEAILSTEQALHVSIQELGLSLTVRDDALKQQNDEIIGLLRAMVWILEENANISHGDALKMTIEER